MAPEMGLAPDKAASILAAGGMEAAEASGEHVAVAVQEALQAESS